MCNSICDRFKILNPRLKNYENCTFCSWCGVWILKSDNIRCQCCHRKMRIGNRLSNKEIELGTSL